MPILDPYHNPIDAIDPEDIRALFDRAIADEAAEGAETREREAAKDFLVAHPEYLANPRNGAILNTALEYSGTSVQSFEDIERVYNDLASRGVLELDGSVLAAQEEEERRARIARARKLPHVRQAEETAADLENAAWTMPLEQLEALAQHELRDQQIRENDSTPAGFGYTPSRSSGFRSRTRSGI